MVKSRKWVLVKHFEGVPKDEDMQLVEEELVDELKEDGKKEIFFLYANTCDIFIIKISEVLCELVYLSVDPYMRPYSRRFLPPFVMIGEQLSR
jgi:prostaglandin reductase 1